MIKNGWRLCQMCSCDRRAMQSHIKYQRRAHRAVRSAAMAPPPLRLLVALLATHLQLNFGQQINEGNNLVAVASHKLAAIKQQSHKQNATDTDQTTDLVEKIEVTTNKDLELTNFNSSATYPGSGTITSIKFVRNPAYGGPLPSFSIINSENASDPIHHQTLSPDSAFYNFTSVSRSNEPTYTAMSQVVNKQTEDNVDYISNSPLFISFTPRCSGAVSSQSPCIANALAPQASSPNIATLQSSPLKQQSLQILSSAQLQPSTIQNPTNMRLRFVPASTTIPLQSTAPVKSTVSTQRQVPIQNKIPVQNTAQMPNSIPMQSAVPIQSTLPMQSAIPIPTMVPIQSTIPTQRAISNVPIQNPIANILQNPNMALLLTHVLSQNPVKQECSAPTNARWPSHDQKPTKQTAVNTLLPLLLQLLTEKNNNCCDYKNKYDRTHCYSRYKTGYKKRYDNFDTDFGRSEGNYYCRVNGNKRFNLPLDDTLEDEDYSDEASDYSAEDYDDED